jgi:hypothetical protein
MKGAALEDIADLLGQEEFDDEALRATWAEQAIHSAGILLKSSDPKLTPSKTSFRPVPRKRVLGA